LRESPAQRPGGTGFWTWKALASVPDPPSGFVTVTLPDPVVAPVGTSMRAVNASALTKVVEVTVIPFEKLLVAPLWKFSPLIVTGIPVDPWL
jgi:hypothetical protein